MRSVLENYALEDDPIEAFKRRQAQLAQVRGEIKHTLFLYIWTLSDLTGLVCLSVCLFIRRRSSVWPSSPSRRSRDSLSAPLPHGSGAPSSSEPCPLLALPPIAARLSICIEVRGGARGQKGRGMDPPAIAEHHKLPIMSQWADLQCWNIGWPLHQ